MTPVPPVGTSLGNIFFPTKARHTIPAVPGSDIELGSINKSNGFHEILRSLLLNKKGGFKEPAFTIFFRG
jgi:hypothetical protein